MRLFHVPDTRRKSGTLPPLSARLLPRLARTQKVYFFVQVLPPGQRAAHQGLRSILCEPEIVQECADLCGDFWQEKTAIKAVK